jgi:positive regulator of sigma E activity
MVNGLDASFTVVTLECGRVFESAVDTASTGSCPVARECSRHRLVRAADESRSLPEAIL